MKIERMRTAQRLRMLEPGDTFERVQVEEAETGIPVEAPLLLVTTDHGVVREERRCVDLEAGCLRDVPYDEIVWKVHAKAVIG